MRGRGGVCSTVGRAVGLSVARRMPIKVEGTPVAVFFTFPGDPIDEYAMSVDEDDFVKAST